MEAYTDEAYLLPKLIRRTIQIGRLIMPTLALVFLLGCSTPDKTPEAKPSAARPATAQPTASAALTPFAPSTPRPTPSYVGKVVCTANKYVNIRAQAGTGSRIIGTFSADDTADVIEYLDGWVHISYGGLSGFVSRGYTIPHHAPGIPVPTGDWAMILVNPTHLLPVGFEVALADFENGQVDARILNLCNEMFADAAKDGVSFQLVDAYRSEATQSKLFEKKVGRYLAKGYSRKDAEEKAATITARPNTSEHQTGLALDIVTPSYTQRNKGFADTEAFKWLNANAHNYGFTLRYKQDKVSITKVIYEPWHWRFVGVSAATDMKKSGQCLEEYLGDLD